MTRHTNPNPRSLRRRWGAILLAVLASVAAPVARADVRVEGPEVTVRRILLANPVTAPYNLSTAYRNGQVVISGVVGTKQIHDVAIRLAIATGYPIRDDLVIDTGMAHRVAAAQAQAAASGMMAGAPGAGATPMIPSLGLAPGVGTLPYVYPPPLFGRIDDPFFGFEPPLLSYPPWWRAMVAREPAFPPNVNVPANPNDPGAVTAAPPNGNSAGALPSSPIQIPLGTSPQSGTIEMTIDPRGVAVLRGTVPTLADRIAIGQKIAQTAGVREVLNLLQVQFATSASPENPPSPPPPGIPPAANPPAAAGPAIPQNAQDKDAAAQPAIVVDGGPLTDRLTQAFARRPALAGLPISVTIREGIATLAGRVPTVIEAMQAYRVVSQTPGVRDVIDRLEFAVPDGERQNPLITQARPEDVEPYLTAQIRRNVGDLAHIDRVRVLGDSLELWGTLVHADDRPRLDAILRSIAVLRGFRLEPHIDVD